MKNKPLWQKVLIGEDMVCAVGAFSCLIGSLWMGYPENETAVLLQGGYMVLMGLHFVLQGILNWRENRWFAIFELGAVAFVLVLVVLKFIR